MPGLAESALYAAVGAALLEVLRDFVEHPLPVIGLHRTRSIEKQPAQSALPRVSLASRLIARLRAHKTAPSTNTAEGAAQVNAAKDGTYQPLPVPPNLPRRDAKKQRPDDIIKIELD